MPDEFAGKGRARRGEVPDGGPSVAESAFRSDWGALADVGRDARSGGYRRFAWTREDATLREWFAGRATRLGMEVVTDRCGNLWAWSCDPDAAVAAGMPPLVLGSHLDSVPDGGAYDGPLGVVSAFAALELLQAQGRAAGRPLGIACFADEEGARFGVACAGSRLLTGVLDPDRGRALTDADGVSVAEAMQAAGVDPARVGRDPETLRRIGTFVELHVEQGRALIDEGSALGVASAIWPHGRWRLDLHGHADHAGTTRLEDRDDPMLRLATAVTTARGAAERNGTVATIGKVAVHPNGVNAIPSLVSAWLDARGADPDAVRRVVAEVSAAVVSEAIEESWTPSTGFDEPLQEQLAGLLGGVPVLPTGAGHDAGILSAAGIRSAMLFVRNPTGVSHSPAEHAEDSDCVAGIEALARVVEDLA